MGTTGFGAKSATEEDSFCGACWRRSDLEVVNDAVDPNFFVDKDDSLLMEVKDLVFEDNENV